MKTTGTIIYIISLLSPVSIFLVYYFNACLAHNLYITFYTYKNDFHKRIYYYKISALIFSLIVIIVSFLFNSLQNISTNQFSISYYPNIFIGCFYLICLSICVYIITKILYVQSKKSEFFSFLEQGKSNYKKKMIIEFVRKHISYLICFLLCYLPNNVIILIQLFSRYRICNDCFWLSFLIYLMSSSALITFLIKFTEPYMQKYTKLIIVFLKERKFTKVRK